MPKPDKPDKNDKPSKPRNYGAKRYTISVTGKTYQHLHLVVEDSSIQKFVDALVRSALDDAAIRDRILSRCTPKKRSSKTCEITR